VYLRARYYDPKVGRFLTRDPVLSEHPYSYAHGNPVNMTDPSGRNPLVVAMGIGAAIGGTAGGLDYYLNHQGCFDSFAMGQAIIYGAVGGMAIGGMGYGTFALFGVSATIAGVMGGSFNVGANGRSAFSGRLADFVIGFGYGLMAYRIASIQTIGGVGGMRAIVGRSILITSLGVLENETAIRYHEGRAATGPERGKAALLAVASTGVGEGLGELTNVAIKRLMVPRQLIRTDTMMMEEWLRAYEGGVQGILNQARGNYGRQDLAEIWLAYNTEKTIIRQYISQQPNADLIKLTRTAGFLGGVFLGDSEIYPPIIGWK